MDKNKKFFLCTQKHPLVCLIFGLVCGIVIGRFVIFLLIYRNIFAFIQYKELSTTSSISETKDYAVGAWLRGIQGLPNKKEPEFKISTPPLFTNKNLVLIGVMTAKKYLNTRVLAASQTWVPHVPGKVMFFSSEGSEKEGPKGIEIVGLKGVDDSYPPQKKSFMMLKYMHDHFLDKFKFFIRADDDIYVKSKNLRDFLHTIPSSDKPLFIGQAGFGNKEEFGSLYLKEGENFCMGGPSMIFNRQTLALMVPNIRECLNNIYTTHEDVELGRCVSKFAKTTCTWAYEMSQILYNNYKEPKGSFSQSLNSPDINRAVTLHPFKNSTYLYRAHHHFVSKEISALRQRSLELRRRIQEMNEKLEVEKDSFLSKNPPLSPSLLKFRPRSPSEVLSWDYLTAKYIYSHKNTNPRMALPQDLKESLDLLIPQLSQQLNLQALKKGRFIDFKELLYGYHKLDFFHGSDLILDMLLTFKRFRGRKKMTIPVRRHVYLQQPFLQPEMRIDPRFPQMFDDQKNDFINEKINFILPLIDRHQIFQKFISNFEEIFLKTRENVSLTLMLFKNNVNSSEDVKESILLMKKVALRYPWSQLKIKPIDGPFSRGRALQLGAMSFQPEELLFFIDVDIHMSREVLLRARLNTVRGKQVYYPVVFSQFNPKYSCHWMNEFNWMSGSADEEKIEGCPPFSLDSHSGYWREFGYGIASMYKQDFISVGGFDLKIKGWGKEDVDLMNRFLQKNVTIMRSVDPGLIHIYHTVTCDPNLDPLQFKMCLGTKASNYASKEVLANIIFDNKNILNRKTAF